MPRDIVYIFYEHASAEIRTINDYHRLNTPEVIAMGCLVKLIALIAQNCFIICWFYSKTGNSHCL